MSYCTDCDDDSPGFDRLCSICGSVRVTRTNPSSSSDAVGFSAAHQQTEAGLFDMLGEGLRNEIESFIQRGVDKPISREYLSTIGKVVLDERRSLLHDVRITLTYSHASEDHKLTFMAIHAGFGPLMKEGVSGKAKIPSNEFGDSPIDDVNGVIAFLRRGAVTFVQKTKRAEEAGALAVVVLQTYAMWPFVMTNSSSEEEALTIPSVMVSMKDSELLCKMILEIPSIELSMRCNELNVECAICQDEMCAGQTIVKLPGCGHAYHDVCVLSWLEKQHTCPLCRLEMPKREADAGSSRPQLSGHMASYYN
jgi:hypothetical protein